jgi:hypothetical protein
MAVASAFSSPSRPMTEQGVSFSHSSSAAPHLGPQVVVLAVARLAPVCTPTVTSAYFDRLSVS